MPDRYSDDMPESAWSHDPPDPMAEPQPEPGDATIYRSSALTLERYLDRERERIANGPSMAQWLEEVRSLDWSGVRAQDMIADIREYRDRDE